MKRKEVCIQCGINPQETHSLCNQCHYEDFDEDIEKYFARAGNDYIGRCDEKNCFICDSYKWSSKLTRPPKYTKKELLTRARGNYGRKNKQSAIQELERRRARDNKESSS